MNAGLGILAVLVQGILIFIDEFFCHRRRDLPKWELVGHPIDTFCLMAFFTFLLVASPHETLNQFLGIGLGIVSCLIITKDEWVHKNHATAFESWLHALLFVTHSVVVV